MPNDRLRAVPDQRRPVLIDPPDPDTLTDDWKNGWQACRETIAAERIRLGRAVEPDSGATIILGIGALSGFIVGFGTALALFA